MNAPEARTTVFTDGAAHVDIVLRQRALLMEIQVWRGMRWPSLERRWFAAARRGVPWFSLEQQVLSAVTYVTGSPMTVARARALRAEIGAAGRRLRWEMSG